LNYLKVTFVAVFLVLAGCSSHYEYVKSPGVSNAKFFQDKMYCQGGASGQSQDATKGERLIPYAECMLNLGYQQKQQ